MIPRFTLIALLALAACNSSDAGSADSGSPDPGGWRLASGTQPTKAEFAALAASCRDRGGTFESCLADLGVKRAQ
jgi:hypothetical protein